MLYEVITIPFTCNSSNLESKISSTRFMLKASQTSLPEITITADLEKFDANASNELILMTWNNSYNFG